MQQKACWGSPFVTIKANGSNQRILILLNVFLDVAYIDGSRAIIVQVLTVVLAGGDSLTKLLSFYVKRKVVLLEVFNTGFN